MTFCIDFMRLKKTETKRLQKNLLHSDLRITEVTFSSGFNDLSYFIKIFKREKVISHAKLREV